MANNHDSKLKEAQAAEKALKESNSMSDVSGWDLIKAGVAKLTDKAAEIKETVVSSDPKTRKEQEYIRKVSSANLRSECEALGTAAGQTARKAIDVVYGASKGVVRGAVTGGSSPKKASKEDKPKASNS